MKIFIVAAIVLVLLAAGVVTLDGPGGNVPFLFVILAAGCAALAHLTRSR